jgi:hypothetical protein
MLNMPTLNINSGRWQQLHEFLEDFVGKNDMIIEQSKEYNVQKCKVSGFCIIIEDKNYGIKIMKQRKIKIRY